MYDYFMSFKGVQVSEPSFHLINRSQPVAVVLLRFWPLVLVRKASDYVRQTSATLPNGNLGLFEALGMQQGSYTWDRDIDDVAHAAFGL
jgi:hypothetical protein